MKNTLITLFSIISLHTFSQNSYDIDQRKGQLFISLGTQLRPLPIRAKNAVSDRVFAVGSNIDNQSSGMAFSYSLDYFINSKFSVGFSHSVRYDLITIPLDEITANFGHRAANNDFIFDYHLYFDYHFKVFKKAKLFLRFGRSFLNRGTDFRNKQTFFDSNGDIIASIFSVSDTAYEPWNWGVGYKKKRISFLVGAYTSSNTEYFIDNSTFVIPYLQFKYNLGKL